MVLVSHLISDFWRYPMSFPVSARPAPSQSSKQSPKLRAKRQSPVYAESSKKAKRKSGGGNANRRSFVDELLPSHQKALLEHQNNLVKAQERLLDARWPPEKKVAAA